MKFYKYGMLALLVLVMLACKSEVQEEHEKHNVAVTKWTDNYELFMEYTEPVEESDVEYIIHLTKLADFKPVTSGRVIIELVPHSGTPVKYEINEIARDGIFLAQEKAPKPGHYNFTLTYIGNGVQETFNVGGYVVETLEFEENENEEHEEEVANHGDEIAFLKEQQWKTKFATGLVDVKTIMPSIPVVGEVLPHQHGYAEIVSPVEGILSVEHNQMMVIPGSKVRKGDVLLTICPSISGSNSWTELQLQYEKAKADYERAERLLAKDAISKREFEEIKNVYLTNKAGYDAFTGTTKNVPSSDGESGSHLGLRAPISGTVAEVIAIPGQNINSGDKLMTILDPDVVWIKMNIFEKDYYSLGDASGAEITLPGATEPVYLDKQNWTILSRGELVDPRTRTIPFLVEIKNPDRLFKVGQSLQLNLYTSTEKEVIAVPKTAVFDEDVQKVVFVQVEGEMFEKRIVETGAQYKGWIEIVSGLEKGERVVTEGGYMVRLASNNTNIGHGHVH